MIVKINQSQGKHVVAICDDDLLGKVFEEDGKILDLSSGFYRGKKLSLEETKEIMNKADNINLVGKQTIDLALKEELMDQDGVRTIKGIPFAHVVITR